MWMQPASGAELQLNNNFWSIKLGRYEYGYGHGSGMKMNEGEIHV